MYKFNLKKEKTPTDTITAATRASLIAYFSHEKKLLLNLLYLLITIISEAS